MNRRIEFIESYIKIGNDYQWSDNHGELVRCKDCINWWSEERQCMDEMGFARHWNEDDYCSRGKRREE